jgi:uncharacterized protein YjbI with pentapeptide repeats
MPGRPDPAPPELPSPLEPATGADHDLEDEATFVGLAFGVALPGREAEAVEFEECRFDGADLSGGSLPRARFGDCLLEQVNLANLRADRASMLRVRLAGCRMTGLHWLDGELRDVVVSRCRADLAVFRASRFHYVRFEDCHLARADFQDADLRGAEFVDCDLTAAQFSHATMSGTRFRRCNLSGVGGMTSFGGAVFIEQDLVDLSHTFAAALGIELREAP